MQYHFQNIVSAYRYHIIHLSEIKVKLHAENSFLQEEANTKNM